MLSGKLDEVGCDYLLSCVENRIENGYTKIILDCDKLAYISSMGLGMLVRVHSRMKKHGGDVKLASVHGVVADLLSMVRLDKVLEIYPSVGEAIVAYSG